MDASKVLYKSTEDALQSLGKEAARVLTLQLIERGVEMAPNNFDINKFAPALNKLLGEGSETILELVYRNLRGSLGLEVEVNPALPVLEKINKVLEAKKMS